jgi:cytochrome c2
VESARFRVEGAQLIGDKPSALYLKSRKHEEKGKILMAECKLCHSASNDISKELAVCLTCIRERPGSSAGRGTQECEDWEYAFTLDSLSFHS